MNAIRRFLMLAAIGVVLVSIRMPFLFDSVSIAHGEEYRKVDEYRWGIRTCSLLQPQDRTLPAIKVSYIDPQPSAYVFAFLGLPIPEAAQARESWSYFDQDFNGIWDLRMSPTHPVASYQVLDANTGLWETSTIDQLPEINNFVHFAFFGDRSEFDLFYERRQLVESLRVSANRTSSEYCRNSFLQAAQTIESDPSLPLNELESIQRHLLEITQACVGTSEESKSNRTPEHPH